jgi:CheY-like chemotaxis protein
VGTVLKKGKELAEKLQHYRVRGGADMRKQSKQAVQKQEEEATKRKSVLIVEDEAIMRDSLRDWLEDGGYEVETAEQGEEALQKIGEVDFGIVVLDMRLPGKDGLEVLKEAKAQRPQFKGIIITAYPSVETAVEAMKSGAVDYLVKPVDPDALERLIQETLGPVQVEIRPIAPVEEAVVEEVVEEVKKVRNLVFTRFHPLCMLCRYSGFSDYCQFFQTGKCIYHEAIEESKRLQKQRAAAAVAKD